MLLRALPDRACFGGTRIGPRRCLGKGFGNCRNIYRLVRTLSKRVSEKKAGVRNASLATSCSKIVGCSQWAWPVAEYFREVLEDLSWPVADESVADDFHEEPLGFPCCPGL